MCVQRQKFESNAKTETFRYKIMTTYNGYIQFLLGRSAIRIYHKLEI